MFRMQSIAQSGGWRIVVSVKILADFSRRRIRPGVEIQPVRSELSFGRLPDAHFCQKKTTSNHGALRVRKLNEKENGRCTKYLSPRRSNIGGEGRNAIILSSSSPRSLGGAPASVVQPRRPMDCTPWAECGERDRWNWTERGSSAPRFRYAIFRFSRANERRNENARFNLFARVIAQHRSLFRRYVTFFSSFSWAYPFAWSWPFCAVQLCSSICTCPWTRL